MRSVGWLVGVATATACRCHCQLLWLYILVFSKHFQRRKTPWVKSQYIWLNGWLSNRNVKQKTMGRGMRPKKLVMFELTEWKFIFVIFALSLPKSLLRLGFTITHSFCVYVYKLILLRRTYRDLVDFFFLWHSLFLATFRLQHFDSLIFFFFSVSSFLRNYICV